MNYVERKLFSSEANNTSMPFDFDTWLKLAQSDPEAFELQRRSVINGLVVTMVCRDDSLEKMRSNILHQPIDLPSQEILPGMMEALGKAFGQLNEEFTFRVRQWQK